MRTHEEARAMRFGPSAGATSVGARRGRWAAGLLAACAILVGAAPAMAQGWIDPLPRVRDWGVVKVRSSVMVRVTGRVAEVEVEEWFENRGGGLGEGDYLYPLPGEAVFSSFSLYQGDRELRGETMNAGQARRIYEEIVRRKRDPALIELIGHGLIRGRVFPIEPGQRRKITLRYTQVLERAGDAVQFRYAAGSRFAGPPVRPVPGRPRPVPLTPGGGVPEDVPVDFTLIADGDAYRDPFSPTHELDVERRRGELRVRPVGELYGDLSVLLPVAGERVGLALVAHRPAGEDGYFMLTLSPGAAERGGTPRDITAVVDVSGSMSGQKLEQTREALHQLLGSLGPDDRFRLVAFSNRVRISGSGWSRASGDDLREARRWVDDLVADGGTNIAGALEEAFRLESPEERLPIVVFLTDGLPTVGERDPERIAREAERSGGRTRVFAFGVGYDVNTYLLDRLSAAGRGSTEYVEPGEDVEVALGALAGKITHPVLTDLEIIGAPVRLEEIYPATLPDLFAGEDLVVFGRYENHGGGPLRVRGRRAGRTESFDVAADFPERAEANDFIPRLWASRKLGELTRQVRLHGPDEELIEAIRSTALRYGLLSEYTSYLVQEPEMLADGAVGLERLAVTAARAPAAQAGAAAVKASERSRARREVASAADLDVAEEAALDAVVTNAGEAVRVVAGRTFRLENGVWAEVGAGDPGDGPEVEVELYSPAYFALIRALPELEPVLKELEPVRIRGRQVTLRFGDGGATTVSAGELDRLVARFRDR